MRTSCWKFEDFEQLLDVLRRLVGSGISPISECFRYLQVNKCRGTGVFMDYGSYTSNYLEMEPHPAAWAPRPVGPGALNEPRPVIVFCCDFKTKDGGAPRDIRWQFVFSSCEPTGLGEDV